MLNVRPAQATDREFVIALIPRFLGTTPIWRSDDELLSGTMREFMRAFDSPSGSEVVFICENEHREQLGFAWIVSDRDFFTGETHAHVSEIAAVRDGLGVGRALMMAAETWARERGDRYISLNVQARNEAAHGFYQRLGYDVEKVSYAKPLRDSTNNSSS